MASGTISGLFSRKRKKYADMMDEGAYSLGKKAAEKTAAAAQEVKNKTKEEWEKYVNHEKLERQNKFLKTVVELQESEDIIVIHTPEQQKKRSKAMSPALVEPPVESIGGRKRRRTKKRKKKTKRKKTKKRVKRRKGSRRKSRGRKTRGRKTRGRKRRR